MKLKKYEIWGCGQRNQGLMGVIRSKSKARAEKRLGEKYMYDKILKLVEGGKAKTVKTSCKGGNYE